MSQELREGKLPRLFEAVSLKSLQLQQAIRSGDDQLVRILDREIGPMISEIVDYRATSRGEIHQQLRFISSLIREDADDRSCVVRNSTILSVLLDRYFGNNPGPVMPDIPARLVSSSMSGDDGLLNEAILNALPDMVAVVTSDYRYLYANAAHATSLRRKPFDLVGRPVMQFIGERAFEDTMRIRLDRCFLGEDIGYFQLHHDAMQGTAVQCRMSPLKTQDGHIVGAVLSMHVADEMHGIVSALG